MKISVITTTYNRKELLQETIESVQKSILAPLIIEWEHIVYDNGSIDNTAVLFAAKYAWKNIIYIRSQENKGPSYARNRAIEKATGDYIFMIDSDDIILQRTLYNFAEAALAHPETSWFISDFLRVDDHLSYIIGDDYYGWSFESREKMLQAIFEGKHFIQSNVFFKKEIFHETGGFDDSLWAAEDIDLFVRFLFAGYLPLSLPFISHLHRVHDSNLSKGITPGIHNEHIKKLMEKYREKLSQRNILV